MVMYDEFVQSITENVEETLDEAWFHNSTAPHREPNQPIPGPIVTEIPVTSTTVRKGFTYEVTLTSSDTLLETGGVSIRPTDTFWDTISTFDASGMPSHSTSGVLWSSILPSPSAVRAILTYNVSGSNNQARLWFAGFSNLQTISWGSRHLRAGQFTHDGNVLCLFTSTFDGSSGEYTTETWKYLWDSGSNEYVYENDTGYEGFGNVRTGCSDRHPSENYIAVGHSKGITNFCDLVEFDTRNPTQIASIRRNIREILESDSSKDANWDSVSYNHDGSLLAGFAGENNKVYIYGPSASGTGPSSTIISTPASSSSIRQCKFSKTGQWIAIAWGSSSENIRIYETTGWTEVTTISGPGGAVNSIDFSVDDEHMAVVYGGGQIRVYRTSSWNEVYSRSGATGGEVLFNQHLTNESDTTSQGFVVGRSNDSNTFIRMDLKTITQPHIIYQNFPALDVETGDMNIKGSVFFNPRRPR